MLLARPLALLALVFAAPAFAAEPKAFALVYNHGYSGDNLPTDKDQFEALVKSARAAHFNVILCQYEPWRAEICKKHGLLVFVDLLVPAHHVYKNPDAAKKLCQSLKGNDAVYGYHIWSDNITDATVPGRTRDAKNVREWDDTHPVYVGTTYMQRVNRVEGYDVFGYYDFHWKRGGHWDHLNKAMATAQAKKLGFLRYDDAVSGLVGKGNPNRVGYTFATSVPFGLKGAFYHFSADIVDKKTFALTPLGEDLKKVNARFASVGDELMKIGVPTAVYSTARARDAKNDEVPLAVPAGLKEFPKDHWFRVARGEVLVGQFADAEKRDVLVFANHNPYATQQVELKFASEPKALEVFDRASKKWVPLKGALAVEDHGVELVRVTK